ncbi:hypothetical protein DFH09DRAFT_1069755 [Mycena vulgaris]|nr:hypothetical protein DFH09DRAFT_1069755 [Mycena vulgaris]
MALVDAATAHSTHNWAGTSDSAWASSQRAPRAADRARLADITPQISELERSLRPPETERDLLHGRLAAYAYAVLTLPNEIVSEIFVHFLPPYPMPPLMIGFLSPALLCQIYRKWREIALSTPKRSDYPYTNNGESSRSWRLYFMGPLPFLRSLESLLQFEVIPTSVDSLVMFHTAPLLRRVTFTAYTDKLFEMPLWSNLTVLIVDWIKPYQYITVLNLAVNLTHCQLNRIYNEDEGESKEIPPQSAVPRSAAIGSVAYGRVISGRGAVDNVVIAPVISVASFEDSDDDLDMESDSEESPGEEESADTEEEQDAQG